MNHFNPLKINSNSYVLPALAWHFAHRVYFLDLNDSQNKHALYPLSKMILVFCEVLTVRSNIRTWISCLKQLV
jgi:hypothetical protein